MKSFLLSGPDNGKYAYDQEKSRNCSGCGLVDRENSKRNEFKSLRYDYSSTYDNESLISVKIYKRLLEFVPASNFEPAGNYYYVMPENKIELNSEKRKVRYGGTCAVCHKPSHVIGITPCILKKEITQSGIYSSDLHFGDVKDYGANLTPAIIITEDILNAVLPLQAKGMYFEPTQS